MSEKIIHLTEGAIKHELQELVRSSVEETLNKLLEQEASELLKAGRHEHTSEREGYREVLGAAEGMKEDKESEGD
jgi:transposase-like protein